MNFPSDSNTIGIDGQFMLGSGILVSPVLNQGATSVSAYFPQGLWYNLFTRTLEIDSSTAGSQHTLNTPLTATNVHVQGGTILPMQDSALTTTAGRQTPFTFLVALSSSGKAAGDLFWDDGEQIALTQYLTLNFEAVTTVSGGSFTAKVANNSYGSANKVGSVVVMGKDTLQVPTKVLVNGIEVSLSQVVFDATKKTLSFINLDLSLNQDLTVTWVY